MVGASDSVINDDAVEGWRWGEFGASIQPADQVTPALKALDWLHLQQSLIDGGYYGGDTSSVEALLAIGSNNNAASEWRREPTAPSLAGYWLGRARPYSSGSAAAAGKLAVGLTGTEMCLSRNSMRPSAFYSATTGIYQAGAGAQSWAMLGTAALSETVPANAVTYPEGPPADQWWLGVVAGLGD